MLLNIAVTTLAQSVDQTPYFFGFIGIAIALVFASITKFSLINNFLIDFGSAYGCAKAGVGICSTGVIKPDNIMRSVVPVVMAGIKLFFIKLIIF